VPGGDTLRLRLDGLLKEDQVGPVLGIEGDLVVGVLSGLVVAAGHLGYVVERLK